MLRWITIYSQQIKNQEKEIYGLKLKHYLKDQNISQPPSQPPSRSPSSQPPSQPPLQSPSQPPSQPFFKSLDEYFKY